MTARRRLAAVRVARIPAAERRIAYRLRERLIGMGAFEEGLPEAEIDALAAALLRWNAARRAAEHGAEAESAVMIEQDLCRRLAEDLRLIRAKHLAPVGGNGADADLLRLLE